ncbi:MAG: hypothetical protein A2020_11680 [Lentisphaerae bacterium GWF2_45_14]|nr:MAG: hypothetical protein A2020_11680 [Lentisphaerae bacterium GWF2_45_14]
MSTIFFNCPNCRIGIEADPSLAGGTAECPGCNSTILIPMPGIDKGMIVAGFKLESKLGTGGMGEVWLAHHTTMDRKVALKILSPGLTSNSEFVERFMKEVRNAAKMAHPNIVTAFDAGVDKGVYYLAISYIDGVELGNLLKIEKIIEEKKALKIIKDIAYALQYAWDEYKILHRDIKPSNIMIDRKGNAKLLDLGISKSLSEDAQLTLSGMIVGTPYYMSPEQALSKPNQDFRADLYSLGATLYHMVVGSVPYDAETAVGILTKHITESLPSPKSVNPNLSESCCALIEIMMAKNKSDRQNSWHDCIRDIDRVFSGMMPNTPTPDTAASFTETREIPSDDGNYTGRLHRFKNFKPRLVTETPPPTVQKINPRHERSETGTQIMRQPSIPPPKKNAGSEENAKQGSSFIENFSNYVKRHFWPIIIFSIIIFIPLSVFFISMIFRSFENLEQELKDIEAKRIIFRIQKQAEPLIKKQEFSKAAELLLQYDGPFAKETLEEREAIAKEYMYKIDKRNIGTSKDSQKQGTTQ